MTTIWTYVLLVVGFVLLILSLIHIWTEDYITGRFG